MVDRTFMSGFGYLPGLRSQALPAFRMAYDVSGKAGNDGRKVGQVVEDVGFKFSRCLCHRGPQRRASTPAVRRAGS